MFHIFMVRFGRLLLPLLLAATAHAQSWPAKPVTLIVPFPPGGFTDNVTRVVSQELAKALGQPVVVENKAGAGGRIGTDLILNAPKDGYTVGLGVPATLSLLPIIDPKYADLARRYAPITIGVSGYMGFAINPEQTKVRTFQEFVAYARANPGKVAYGTPGVGTSYNLWGEIVASAAGFDPLHVPYKGEAPALADLAGGQLQFMMVTGAAKPFVDAGKLMILATTGSERWGIFPNAPTLKEVGIQEVVASGWLAYIAPAGVPQDVLDKLNAAFVVALRQPAVEKALGSQGYTVVASKPDELTRRVQGETALFGKIIQSGRVKLE
jgi:tripartite-type tricarboxylate transporter receptor subunit TctC